ncbi:PEP/pyruvate-binding domain-containing protein [Paractinoplanes rishiriensis]|uniref:Pyruvate, phosphate dikinase n=1 Tax=Paractinoplanes rishiriensis TaxID=1050105 RepID=A0A919JQK1_9ACTN|nr:PEP/pyruvate-binding domain-containing protein [Actinoplanes rishiriensis]GIE93286.1 pyruvate, phosphate dikinase [Actinoplanes rishiriensis]
MIHPLSPGLGLGADLLGGKGHGLVVLLRLGLPVPAGFVVDTRVCRHFLRVGALPPGCDVALASAVRDLEATTGRRLGGPGHPLVVAVRSGAEISMPGMMSTVLNLGLTTEAGDEAFVRDSRERFVAGFTAAGAREIPDDPMAQLRAAVEAVFASWHTPRATTYRELHGIPHDRGTAVVVQAMVFGNRDGRSGTGVAYSRDPSTGAREPFGDVLFGRQGEDVVAGRSVTRPLAELADREPAVWRDLVAGLDRLEGHFRDVCQVEFTFESGRLWFLQVRPGGLIGRAAVRVAVDLADEQLIDRRTAVARISPAHLRAARVPRIRTTAPLDVVSRGRGASPGVAAGRIAVTADMAAQMAGTGPVILVRPFTSPLDMHGLAAATGVVTVRGGPASHAAVVARSMGKPAVVEAAGLTVDAAGGCVRAGDLVLPAGTLITIDGTGGEVVLGDPGTAAGEADTHLERLLAWSADQSSV